MVSLKLLGKMCLFLSKRRVIYVVSFVSLPVPCSATRSDSADRNTVVQRVRCCKLNSQT